MENFCDVGDTRNAIDTMARRPAPSGSYPCRHCTGVLAHHWTVHFIGPNDNERS